MIANRESVRLDLDAVETDLEVLLQAPDDAAVVAGYPGTFLPEDRYEVWSDSTRAAAQARFVPSARREAARLLGLGHYDAAVELAARLRDIDRFDEDAHRLLITALHRAGAVEEADRAQEAYRAAMAELTGDGDGDGDDPSEGSPKGTGEAASHEHPHRSPPST